MRPSDDSSQARLDDSEALLDLRRRWHLGEEPEQLFVGSVSMTSLSSDPLTDIVITDAFSHVVSQTCRELLSESGFGGRWIDVAVMQDGCEYSFGVPSAPDLPTCFIDYSGSTRSKSGLFMKFRVKDLPEIPSGLFAVPGSRSRLMVTGDLAAKLIGAGLAGIEFEEVMSSPRRQPDR